MRNPICYLAMMLTATLLDACDTKTTELDATPETAYLGEIGVEETTTKEFTIRNKGKHPFVLEELVPSCECVVAKLNPETISPGGDAVLTVTFLEHEPIGEFERDVEIYGTHIGAADSKYLGLRDSKMTSYIIRCGIDNEYSAKQ